MPERNPNLIDRMIDIASGEAAVDEAERENRDTRRTACDCLIGFVQFTPSGGKSIPTVVRCTDISAGGMRVVSQYMLHIDHEGAVLMERSNGEEVILGVKVVHCKYVGDMKHLSGLQFIQHSGVFAADDFRDEHGNMPRLDRRRAA